jgi:hypothetical protein
MKPQVTIDTSDLRGRMNYFAQIVGRDVRTELRRFSRIACRELAHTTQPFGFDKAAQEQGTKKVEADISKVFYTPEDGGFVRSLTEKVLERQRNKNDTGNRAFVIADRFRTRLQKYVDENNIAALRKITTNFGWRGVIDRVDQEVHQQARTARRKNVPKRVGEMYLVLAGRRKDTVDTYVKKVQKRVGMAKAGWANCATKIPGISFAKGPLYDFPKWVKDKANHWVPDASRVDASSTFNEADSNPRVAMTNSVPWISENIGGSTVRAALEIARNLFVKEMDKRIKYVLREQANLKAA